MINPGTIYEAPDKNIRTAQLATIEQEFKPLLTIQFVAYRGEFGVFRTDGADTIALAYYCTHEEACAFCDGWMAGGRTFEKAIA
jgi:hypothetical protein